jgi:hypothetical protein
MPKAVIEDQIPPPPRCNVKSYGVTIDLVATIRDMKTGQSFVVDNEDGRQRALKMGVQLDIPLISRVIKDGEKKGCFRIWRKEKE